MCKHFGLPLPSCQVLRCPTRNSYPQLLLPHPARLSQRHQRKLTLRLLGEGLTPRHARLSSTNAAYPKAPVAQKHPPVFLSFLFRHSWCLAASAMLCLKLPGWAEWRPSFHSHHLASISPRSCQVRIPFCLTVGNGNSSHLGSGSPQHLWKWWEHSQPLRSVPSLRHIVQDKLLLCPLSKVLEDDRSPSPIWHKTGACQPLLS